MSYSIYLNFISLDIKPKRCAHVCVCVTDNI